MLGLAGSDLLGGGGGNFGLFGDGGFRINSSVFIKMSQLLLLHFQILSFKT